MMLKHFVLKNILNIIEKKEKFERKRRTDRRSRSYNNDKYLTMKVYEIISENKDQDLDEISGQAVGTILKPLSAVGMWFGRKFGTNFAYVADEIVAKLAAKGRMAGEVTNIEVVRELQKTKLGREMYTKHRDELVRMIKDQSNKYRNPGLWNRVFGKSGPATSSAVRGGEEVAKRSISKFAVIKAAFTAAGLAGYAYEMKGPLDVYMERMRIAAEWLENGQATKDQYDAYQRQQALLLVKDWSALIATAMAVGLPFKAFTGTIGVFVPSLGKALSLLNMPAQIAFMDYINRSKPSETIASLLAVPFVEDTIGGMIAPHVQWMEKQLASFYKTGGPADGGGTGPKPADDKADSKDDKADSKDDRSSTSAEPDKPVTAPKPEEKAKDEKTAQANKDQTDPKNWVPIPGKSGFVRNIKTNDVDYEINWKK